MSLALPITRTYVCVPHPARGYAPILIFSRFFAAHAQTVHSVLETSSVCQDFLFLQSDDHQTAKAKDLTRPYLLHFMARGGASLRANCQPGFDDHALKWLEGAI